MRRARIAVTTTFFVHGMLFASWAAHIPHLQRAIGATNASLGTALLGAPLGSVLAMIAVGKLLPALGSRRVLRVTLVGYCLAGTLTGFVTDLVGLFLALAVWGVFQGALDVAMNTQGAEVEHAHGGAIMAGFHAFWSIGAFAGALVGVAAVGAHITLTTQLLPLGAAAAVVTQSLGRWLLPPEVGGREHPRRAAPAGPRWSARVLLLGVITFASMFCEGAAVDWSAVHMRTDLSATAPTAGLAYAAYACTMVVARLGAPRIFRRVRPGTLIPTLAVLAAIAMTAGLLSRSQGVTIAGFAVLGLGLATVVPTSFSAASRLGGISPGAGIATVSAIGWAGFICGPPAIGHLSAAIGLTGALGTLPLLCVAIALVAVAGRLFPAARP